MKRLVLIVVAASTILSCMAIPKWYNLNTVRKYEDEKIVGIGQGTSRETAINNARDDMLQQITVRVETQIESYAIEIEEDGKNYYLETIQQSTKLTLDQTVQGMTVEMEKKEKDTWYMMVSISKKSFLNTLKNDLDLINSSLNVLIADADELLDQGKLVPSIQNYIDAQGLIVDLYAKKSLYDCFADKPYNTKEGVTVNSIDSSIRKALAAIRFDVVSGNNQNSKIGKQLESAIVFKANMRNPKTGDISNISGIPVRVFYSDGELIEKGFTNNEGEFSVNVIAVPAQGNKGKVIIKMDVYNLPTYLNSLLNNTIGEAFFKTSEIENIAVQLLIKDKKGMRQEKVEEKLIKMLGKNLIHVNENSHLLLDGTINIKDSREIEGSSGSQFLVNIEVNIQLKDLKANNVIGSMTVSGKGLSVKDEASAIENAYNNIGFNNRDLLQMIASVNEDN